MTDPPQGYELTFDAREGYLYAHISAGAITEQTAKDYLREVADKCVEHRYNRILIHREIPAMLSAAVLFFVVKEFQAMIGDVRVAFVDRDLLNQDLLKFAATVGLNRGAEFRAFNDDEAAESWLLRY